MNEDYNEVEAVESSETGDESVNYDDNATESVDNTKNNEGGGENLDVEEPFINIKYNKEEKGLTREETIALAQKGMNYDKMVAKLDTFQNDPRLSIVDKLAQRQGMDTDSYLKQWEDYESDREKQELMNKGIPEEFLDDFRFAQEQKKVMEEQAKEQETNEKYLGEIQGLEKMLGKDLSKDDIDNLPEEVLSKWLGEGIPLKYAYMEYERPTMRETMEQEVMQNLSKKKSQSTGNINTKTNNVSSDSIDSIRNMSDEEFKKMYL